ncbi:MAG: hypothetical protein AAF828_01530 [Bacteroidota bacterium]
MLRSDIEKWLSVGGSFRAGVELLERAGSRKSNTHRQVMAMRFIRSSQEQRLRSDLVQLLASLPEETPIAPSEYAIPDRPADTPRVAALRREGILVMKERSDLKGRLLLKALDEPDNYTDEDRYELARKIMAENVPAADNIYGQIRRYEEQGIEPASDRELIRKEAINQMKERQSIMPQISRLKKAKSKGEDFDADKLANLEARLIELNRLLEY